MRSGYKMSPVVKQYEDRLPALGLFEAQTQANVASGWLTDEGVQAANSEHAVASGALRELAAFEAEQVAAIEAAERDRAALIAAQDTRDVPLSPEERVEAVALAQAVRGDAALREAIASGVATGGQDSEAARRVRLLRGVDSAISGIERAALDNWHRVLEPSIPADRAAALEVRKATASRALAQVREERRALLACCDIRELRKAGELPPSVLAMPVSEKANLIREVGHDRYQVMVAEELSLSVVGIG